MNATGPDDVSIFSGFLRDWQGLIGLLAGGAATAVGLAWRGGGAHQAVAANAASIRTLSGRFDALAEALAAHRLKAAETFVTIATLDRTEERMLAALGDLKTEIASLRGVVVDAVALARELSHGSPRGAV